MYKSKESLILKIYDIQHKVMKKLEKTEIGREYIDIYTQWAERYYVDHAEVFYSYEELEKKEYNVLLIMYKGFKKLMRTGKRWLEKELRPLILAMKDDLED